MRSACGLPSTRGVSEQTGSPKRQSTGGGPASTPVLPNRNLLGEAPSTPVLPNGNLQEEAQSTLVLPNGNLPEGAPSTPVLPNGNLPEDVPRAPPAKGRQRGRPLQSEGLTVLSGDLIQ